MKKFNRNKFRTKGTLNSIIEKVQEIEVETLVSALYLTDVTEFEKWLLQEIEKQIILAKVNPDKFAQGLLNFLKSTSKEVKKSNKYKEFYKLQYKFYLSTKRQTNKKLVALCYDLLIELSTYLAPENQYIYCVDTKGRPKFKNEVYVDLDKITYETMSGENASQEKAIRRFKDYFRKYDIVINNMEDITQRFMEERIITNNHFSITHLIDENYLDFLKPPYLAPTPVDVLAYPPEVSLEEVKEHLQCRRRLLPSKGVYVDNIEGSTIEEIYLKEKYQNGTMFILARIKVKGKYTVVFYDTKEKFFYSIYEDVSNEIGDTLNLMLEYLILTIYATIVTDLDLELDMNISIDDNKPNNTNNNVKRKRFNRNELIKAIHHFEPTTRKLPVGANASEQAIELAKQYGIVLRQGETFVRPFEKTIHKLDK